MKTKNNYFNFLILFLEFEDVKNIKVINLASDLKDELKNLYTAITRTRLKLIIYDEDTTKRRCIEHLLNHFDLVDYVYSIHDFKIKNVNLI